MRARAAVAALLVAALAGCGYSLEGRGITTDPSVKRIGVPLFKDQTGKVDLDSRVTAAVMEELLKRGRFTVARTLPRLLPLASAASHSLACLPPGSLTNSLPSAS